MASRAWVPLMAALLLAAATSHAEAKIFESFVTVDDRPLIPLAEAFGFAPGGQLIFTIQHVSIYQPHKTTGDPDLQNMGLFLSSMESDTALGEQLASGMTLEPTCVLNTLTGNKLPRFSDSAIRKVIDDKGVDSGQIATFEFTIENGGQFYLYFANCEPDTPVSFHIHVEMFNIDSNLKRDYLSVGETELEEAFWVMFALFTSLTAAWAYIVWTNKSHATRLHYLMGALCVFKSLTVMSQALMYHYLERTGYADGWNVVFYIFTLFRGILFFTVVVLIGTGWSYMRPFLGDREKRILMVVIPLQVFANIAIVVMDEEAPSVKDWFTWRDLFHLVDIICCCAILFPIVWSIKNLREASQTDGKAARNLEKLQLFRQFYVMVVVYIYFTRIVVYLIKTTVDYRSLWVADVADQLATLAFFVWTGLKFSPTEANPYLKLSQQESEIEM